MLYDLLFIHLIYNNSIRRLMIILSTLYIILNLSSLISLILWDSTRLFLDPLILTIIPGLLFVKYCLNQINTRIFNLKKNLIDNIHDSRDAIYQINLLLNLVNSKKTSKR